MDYNLLLNGIYWGYNPLTNHLLTSWDIQVEDLEMEDYFRWAQKPAIDEAKYPNLSRIIPVTYLFLVLQRGPITPFITGSGPPCRKLVNFKSQKTGWSHWNGQCHLKRLQQNDSPPCATWKTSLNNYTSILTCSSWCFGWFPKWFKSCPFHLCSRGNLRVPPQMSTTPPRKNAFLRDSEPPITAIIPWERLIKALFPGGFLAMGWVKTPEIPMSFPLEVTTFSTRIQENLDFLRAGRLVDSDFPSFPFLKRNKGVAMNVPQVYVSKPAPKMEENDESQFLQRISNKKQSS